MPNLCDNIGAANMIKKELKKTHFEWFGKG